MSSSVREKLNGIHPQMLRASGEADPQSLGKRATGRALEKAIARSGLTKQEAAFQMGYSDSGVMGRWIQGTETPQLAKLWMLGEGFQREWVIALAEEAGLSVKTTIVA